MSLWHCDCHGLHGPMAMCSNASRAEVHHSSTQTTIHHTETGRVCPVSAAPDHIGEPTALVPLDRARVTALIATLRKTARQQGSRVGFVPLFAAAADTAEAELLSYLSPYMEP